mgnify:CR=1 FL=1
MLFVPYLIGAICYISVEEFNIGVLLFGWAIYIAAQMRSCCKLQSSVGVGDLLEGNPCRHHLILSNELLLAERRRGEGRGSGRITFV